MRFRPTQIYLLFFFICFVFISVLISCSKDSDLLLDSVLKESEEKPKKVETSEATKPSSPILNPIDSLEQRTSSFRTIQDAYVQNGLIYNQNIVRLEENQRTSYLMFDLSPIDSIGGIIKEAKLEFTINKDDGNGKITIYKGKDSNWTENEISNNNIPETDEELGSVSKEYKVGTKEEVNLDITKISSEKISLVLNHEGANDLAFASKEHSSKIGPKLIVTYDAPKDTEIIIPEEEDNIDGTGEEINELIAIADATLTSGKAPLEVSFTGSNSTSSDSIVSYIWDFNDTIIDSIANPTHVFNNVGVYEVVLTITDINGVTDSDLVIITAKEEDNLAPIANLSASPLTGNFPLEVQFIGDKSSDDSSIVSYFWDFKDGSTANTANPSHSFSNEGSYEVELTVKDEHGLENKKTVVITVEGSTNNAPVSTITASSTSGEAPSEIQFLSNNSTDDKGITRYFWDFNDGSTTDNKNPSHTFVNPGNYNVQLTVYDDEGLNHTSTINITINPPNVNTLPGYYVTSNGNSFNDGLSENNSWSLEHAFKTARPGDIVYVKSGNYGYQQIISGNHGTSSQPIKFIGYSSIPGDVTSSQGSTFSYGESLNSNKMPLLSSSSSGNAITLYHKYIHIENFQITGYTKGINSISAATNTTLKNIIVTNSGSQTNSTLYDGFAIEIRGNNSKIENCFILNANAEAIKLFDSDYSVVNNCEVYSDNTTNPTDYYFLITGGTQHSVVKNSYADRNPELGHGGHGFTMKDLAENNLFYNCTANRTSFELNFGGVKHNTIEGCFIYGNGNNSGQWESRLAIFNGANNNIIKNMTIQNTWTAITWLDNDDGYVGPGGDRDEVSCGYDNVFDGVNINDTNSVLRVGDGEQFNAWARRNTFVNCNFSNFNTVAVTYTPTEDILFKTCSFSNGNKLYVETGGIYEPYSSFDVSFENCSWSNVNFSPPN